MRAGQGFAHHASAYSLLWPCSSMQHRTRVKLILHRKYLAWTPKKENGDGRKKKCKSLQASGQNLIF